MKSGASRPCARSAGRPGHTRTTSGAAPPVAHASQAITPVPLLRLCPAKVEHVHGPGSVSQKWNPAGSVPSAWPARIPATSARCAADCARTAESNASPAAPSSLMSPLLVNREASQGQAGLEGERAGTGISDVC